MRQRDISLDLMRIIACAMVVLMHSPIPTENANGLLLSSLSYFTAPCIGLFFMVSGALLLPPPQKNRKHEAMPFLKKRFKRVLLPTLVWALLYIIVKLYDDNLTTAEFLKSVLSIPFSAQGHGVLWFMYTLLGLYLITPILHAWLQNAKEREIRFYLSLWLIAMCYPILKIFVDINDTPTGILYYFSGYIGYYVLGYWMLHYENILNFKVSGGLMCVSLAAPMFVKLMHWTVDFYTVFWYLSVFVVAQCVFWWKVMKSVQFVLLLSDRTKSLLTLFSNLSFGIYLSHIIIMRHIVWEMPFVVHIQSQLLQTIIVAFLTLVLSFGVSLAFSVTPLGNAVVGWRKK